MNPFCASGPPGLLSLWLMIVSLLIGGASWPAQGQVLLAQQDLPLLEGVAVRDLRTARLFHPDRTDVIALRVPAADLTGMDRSLVIQRQVTDGQFVNRQVLAVPRAEGFVLQDLDSDGDVDLLVAHGFGTTPVTLWLNLGNGGGAPGVFQRQLLSFSGDIPGVVGLCAPGTLPGLSAALVLVRSGGRPAELMDLDDPIASGEGYRLSQEQSLPHPDGRGVLCGDFNNDGRGDVLVLGSQTDLWLGSTGLQPLQLASSVSALQGLPTTHTATARDLNGDGLLELILSSDNGDLLLQHQGNDTGGNPQWSLLGQLDGTRRSDGFAWFDADGDDQLDLISARDAIDVAPLERGSRVLLRQGLNFTPAQRLAPARSLASAEISTLLGDGLWLGSSQPEFNALWQIAGLPPPTPLLRFWQAPLEVRPNRYYFPSQLGMDLEVVPFAPTDLSVSFVAIRTDPPPSNKFVRAVDVQAGESEPLRFLRNVPTTPGKWRLSLLGAMPAGAVQLSSPTSIDVVIVQDTPLDLLCYISCLLIGICTDDDMASAGAGTGSLMGTLAEVQLLQRLRDERMAGSAGGQHYIALYESLQVDLHAASFVDATFYLRLWDLKDAWMPAVTSLVDGDGSALINAEMMGRLQQVLRDFQVYGSATLVEAIEHERAALDLGSLAGLPISVLQQRWERNPLFADQFE
ncbi:MAG: VCBS repeat-containing protein [Lysobacterales bacterium]